MLNEGVRYGYKVVIRRNGLLYSCMYPWVAEPDVICAEYTPLQWTFPRKDCGPLAVFSSKIAAVQFIDQSDEELWLCEYIPARSKVMWHPDKSGKFFHIQHLLVWEVPPRTVLAAAVRLTAKLSEPAILEAAGS